MLVRSFVCLVVIHVYDDDVASVDSTKVRKYRSFTHLLRPKTSFNSYTIVSVHAIQYNDPIELDQSDSLYRFGCIEHIHIIMWLFPIKTNTLIDPSIVLFVTTAAATTTTRTHTFSQVNRRYKQTNQCARLLFACNDSSHSHESSTNSIALSN